MNVGRNILKERSRRDITQAELARRLKRSRSNVHRWENGGPGPRLSELDDIAAAIGCQVADLVAKPKRTKAA